MTIDIKREKWKGKYRLVARDQGKMISWAKWSQRFNKETASRILKTNNSFNKDIFRDKLKNVYEVTDYRIDIDNGKVKSKVRKSKTYGSFQYVISAWYKRKKISARSSQYPNSSRVNVARNEALENIYSALSTQILGETDKDEGKKIFDKLSNIKEGIIYYAKI